MAPIQSTAHMNMASCQSPVRAEGTRSQFPAGLRVLVVDDDPTCLKILEKMLCKCLYEVTTCCLARVALSMLREKKGSFDVVISDVYMPDMDGFKLLEHVGLEMDLPVIMMSADGETSVVMKGIKHGACDYLIKPIRMEELQNIWQHVIRKKRNETKELELSGSADDSERLRKGLDDGDYASSVNEGVDWKLSKKRKEPKEEEDDGNQENDDPSSLKKPRVVWSVELHQQFVSAVDQLGIDKAVPKRILEMMNVQGLTRENIASHLQKYRLYLKRLSEVAHQQGGMNSSFAVSRETNFGSMDSLGRFDLRTLVASGQISPQTLVAVQAGFSARTNSNNGSGMPEEALLQTALQGVNGNPSNRLTIGQSLMKSHGNMLQGLTGGIERNPFSQIQQNMPSFGGVGSSMDESSGSCMLQQQLTTTDLGTGGLGQICGINKNEPLNPPNNVSMMQLRKQQQQWQHHHHQQQLQLQRCAQHEGAQLQGGHVHNLSSTNFLGPQVLSDHIGGATMSLSTIINCSTSLDNNVINAYSPIQGNCISPVACELTAPVSSAPIGIGRRLPIDYKNSDIPTRLGNNFSLSSTVGSSALLTSIGTEAETHMPVLQSISGMNDISQTLEESSFNFCAFNGLGQSTSQNGRQGWQVQNTSHSQDLSQTISPILNQGYGKTASGFQGLNVPHRQDQGQVRSLGFGGSGLDLPGKFASDAGYHRAISNVQFQGGQTMADNSLRMKGEDALDSMGYSKIDNGLFSEQFPPSYEIMDLLFKQERLGLAEGGDFGVDGHQLNNIHVK